MTDTDRIDRYIVLVEKLAPLEHEMKLLQGEIQTLASRRSGIGNPSVNQP
jgi:hypothetical protein